MRTGIPRGEKGQLLVGMIIMMIVMAIIIPVMVMYVQNETRWTLKENRNVYAFQLAEAAVDRGFKKISESTTTWENGQNAVFPTGYMWNTKFADVGIDGGTYTIGYSSGPEANQITIFGTGRYEIHGSTPEVRVIKAIYANAPLGDVAVRGQATVSLTGTNAIVHWGAIITPKAITQDLSAGSKGLFPQYWSASSISMDPLGASGIPNCDSPNCHQWHSYQQNIPPDPDIDLGFYESSATATGTYYEGDKTWGASPCTPSAADPCCNATACTTGKSYYVKGNVTVDQGIYVKGNLVITGNLNLPNGLAGLGDIYTPLPRKAWMQYGNAWATTPGYTTSKDDDSPAIYWDDTAPAEFPGINSDWLGPANRQLRLKKVMVRGFLYVGGNLTQGSGGGDEKIVGACFIGGTVDVQTNNFNVFYMEEAGESIKSVQVILTRKAWQDQPHRTWPAGL